MRLSQVFRLNKLPCLSLVGAGGKTTALFELAYELSRRAGNIPGIPPAGEPVIVTTTTHLHTDQIGLADTHWLVEKPEDFSGMEKNLGGVMLVTGPFTGNRASSMTADLLSRLQEICDRRNLPMLIEADGSRQRPLKAPAEHEPVIPSFVDSVVVVAGLSGLGCPLNQEFVHRPEIFSRLSGLVQGESITPTGLARFLTHPSGGMKNIPPGVRRMALLTQARTPTLQSQAKLIAEQMLPTVHTVVSASLNPPSKNHEPQSEIYAVYEPVAGIILAGGGSSRFGRPKALLDWHGVPFVRAVAETALAASLSPVVVVTGANPELVASALQELPVKIIHNEDWQDGQSSSIQAALRSLPEHPYPPALASNGYTGCLDMVGAAIFLLADQPQISPPVVRALIGEHTRTLSPIVAPLVDGQRANPVLFDRITFPELMALKGDVGGRAIFSKFQVDYLPWHDEHLLSDVDTPEEYRKLVDGE